MGVCYAGMNSVGKDMQFSPHCGDFFETIGGTVCHLFRIQTNDGLIQTCLFI